MQELSEYDKQAQAFLEKVGIVAVITYLDNNPPAWDFDNHDHNHYSVTLRRKDGDKERFVFQFWDSITNSNSGEKPTAYDVLSCISSETTIYDGFAEFCSEFGYDQDSRKAEQMWKVYNKTSRKLNKFFSEEELEDLRQIQ